MAVNDTKTWIGSVGPFLSDSSKPYSGLQTDKVPVSSLDVVRLGDIGGLISAADVVNVPAGNIAATNVQAAINELDTEKAPLASPVFTTQITTPKIVTASGNLEMLPAGNAHVVLQGSGSGKVSIGIATPGDKLHVAGGKLRVDTSNNGYGGFKIYDDTSGGYNTYLVQKRTYANSSIQLGFGNVNTQWDDWSMALPVITLKGDGKVGIGTTTPTSKLQVVGLPTYADNTAALAGGLTSGAFYRTSTGVLMVTY